MTAPKASAEEVKARKMWIEKASPVATAAVTAATRARPQTGLPTGATDLELRARMIEFTPAVHNLFRSSLLRI